MKKSADNPPENHLGPNVEEKALLDAIEVSGYPLQGRAARILGEDFAVTEEWGFLQGDKDPVHRSLDLFCWRKLDQADLPNLECYLATLVECKRSDLPYVFFRDVASRPIPKFPLVIGSPKSEVAVHKRTGNKLRRYPIGQAFGLQEHAFVQAPSRCSSFSRAEPKSSGTFRFSGSEPFNQVVLPLLRAVDHAAKLYKSNGRQKVIRLHLISPVAVIDAPMLLVADPEAPRDATLTPWVRVIRQEARQERWSGPAWYAIDFVHISYLRTYVSNYLLSYADAFASACAKYVQLLASDGEVPDLDNFEWDKVAVRRQRGVTRR